MKRTDLNRRDFNKLTMAAFGGMVAGATSTVYADHHEKEEGDDKKKKKEAHACRGLNTCKNHGAKDNKCAGMGNCSTVKAHSCAGKNECKNQGGCGKTAGGNKCKSHGKCAVPLSDKAWKVARKHFEDRMKKAKKKFGDAPKKKKKDDKKKTA